ncbi:hypothetical protein J2Q11_01045 [Tenacibaculum finnmarkense genomovar finnmarkense]|uniref:DUF4175 family protein n=1 Tax=Tenacibaculum finnmarkense TaxID=2781243 RepID=UPI001E3A4709|nr:DUF4175 family protein [Tenacibaculum finnmarkense]MCD8417002.1 hypothetical protein [Tenacibaculum finnmarkense genomovar finnmarkense]MCG8184605.1 hypothetical protein [Tenacibaculum finnmarkense genomovar finnmarkense]MCG8208689.1 hypothetical protein [Tenacibaculum finnmarkense genomovar finnmarkense]MCG8211420.1 hypothetical protein [Tenacibaculum finnmarkense genomovar finnmarkense]MCG8219520.1 hypothetical protein [Tenacibaculum finnmarkense genomovar finnmarkense]
MENFSKIEQKLQLFSRKYYTSELIKGSILFISLGLLYLLFTLFIEHFLWLKPNARTLLFWLFIIVQLFLLIRFICFPIFKIIGLKQGISFEEASKIIGSHFPEIQDKLLNLLQLNQNNTKSDLLIASINQKSEEIQPVSFNKAIDFKTNIRYLKYALIPLIIWGLFFLTGTSKQLSESFNRVVNHSVAYKAPAPFYFHITAKNLTVIKGKDITVYIQITGKTVPEQAKIHFNEQQYFFKNEGNGLFSYTFTQVQNPVDFYASANGITSDIFKISVINTPSIQNISLHLTYPKYIKKKNEIIKNTGNIIVPQGTLVKWAVKTSQTDSVHFISNNKRFAFLKDTKNKFQFKKQVKKALNYKITTSNKNLKEYEKLQFSIGVTKDEHPTIHVKSNIDSISRGNAQFVGLIADDYGFKKLELVYYDKNNSEQNKQFKKIKLTKNTLQTFFFEFPDSLNLQKGIDYELYFQVFDNDIINGSKKTKSQKFSYRQKTKNEIDTELLQEQRNHIQHLENSLNKQEQQKKSLEKIQFELQNKKNVSWNDQKKIKNLIKRQNQYKKMMQRQTDNLKQNFSEKKEKNEALQQKKIDLKKRIEELKKLDKQQKLLDELKKLAEKLNREDLLKKTKELAEQNKQQEKSLERILEMTKRFYMEQKMQKLADNLKDLSKKQKDLSKKESPKEADKKASEEKIKEEQQKINTDFQKVKKELNELKKDNKSLKSPMEIPKMEDLAKKTQEELNKAEENLEKKNEPESKKNQKKASDKMQEMSQKMQKSMQQMSAENDQENMEGLRQVLENLIMFSFNQEALMTVFSKSNSSHPNFGKNLQKQHHLKTYFEHIDDSLFVLSIKNPKITSKIQDQLSLAHYNLNESLESFADNKFQQGITSQRYIMTAANTLADMLSNVLDAMKNPKPGSGKGKGKGKSFSLPDIIKKQSELMKKMQDAMKKKKGGKSKNGKGGKKKGNKPGEKEGGNKKGDGQGEKLNGELYQIYKEQAQLRQQLEKALQEQKKQGAGHGKGKNKSTEKAIKKMEQLENDILEKGFTQKNIDRMQQLNYQLLKLDKATFEQNKDKKRKSDANLEEFHSKNIKKLKFQKLFYKQTEILNRQSLPLQPDYKKKVQEYFSLPKSNK